MNVNVNLVRVNFQEEDKKRKAPLLEQVLVRLKDCVIDAAINDVTVIQEKILFDSRFSGEVWFPKKSPDLCKLRFLLKVKDRL